MHNIASDEWRCYKFLLKKNIEIIIPVPESDVIFAYCVAHGELAGRFYFPLLDV